MKCRFCEHDDLAHDNHGCIICPCDGRKIVRDPRVRIRAAAEQLNIADNSLRKYIALGHVQAQRDPDGVMYMKPFQIQQARKWLQEV